MIKKKIVATLLSATLVVTSWTYIPHAYANSGMNPEIVVGVETATDTDAVSTETTQENENTENIQDEISDFSITDGCSYIDIGERTDYYEPVGDLPALYSVSIPSSYDSRDNGYVTSVKNQNPYGTCWAFAALGAGESSMLAQGLVSEADNIDLSEYQFAYFFYHYVNDPLGNLTDDCTNAVGTDYLRVGGNNYYSMFALASWRGAADESVAPYEDATATSVLDASLAFQDVAHMQNTYIVSMQNQDDVKKMIMEYGAVASSVYMSEYYYYNSDTAAYYQNASESSNHAILIVGWDDTYAVDNFKSSCQPSNPGAWLIKNSWGNYIQYFWVSYEDLCLSQEDAFVYVFEKADNYDFNYQYDGAYGTSWWTVKNGDALANVFTVSGADMEQIEAAAIALKSDNVAYSLQIYLNPDGDDPLSGEPMLDEPVEGVTTYAGYYTIELDTPITVEYGDRFAVVFTLNNLDGTGNGVSCYADSSISSSWISFESHIEPNQMYYCSQYFGASDLYDEEGTAEYGFCPRIKAFTSAVGEVTDISVDELDISAIEDQVYTGNAITPQPTVKYGSRTLACGSNYSVSYSNNTELGKAQITITGLGRYKGSRTITFNIIGVKNPTTVYNGVDYSAVYDYNYYVTNNADIWKTYGTDDVSVLRHFVNCGMNEGRQGCATFNVISYAYTYVDLRRVYKNDLKKYYIHYINNGKKEGRIAIGTTQMKNYQTVYNGVDYSAVYDYNYYISKYADIKNAYGVDDSAALQHFVNYGMKEGRQGCATFNVTSYAYKYADLRHAFKNDLVKYYTHYINRGKKEGRIATGTTTMQNCKTIYDGVDYSAVYDGTYYRNKYADIKKAYGLDDEGMLKHFVTRGMNEGRQASADFNVYTYKSRYTDLQKSFGNNLKSYYLHYIKYGVKEGRSGK